MAHRMSGLGLTQSQAARGNIFSPHPLRGDVRRKIQTKQERSSSPRQRGSQLDAVTALPGQPEKARHIGVETGHR